MLINVSNFKIKIKVSKRSLQNLPFPITLLKVIFYEVVDATHRIQIGRSIRNLVTFSIPLEKGLSQVACKIVVRSSLILDLYRLGSRRSHIDHLEGGRWILFLLVENRYCCAFVKENIRNISLINNN